MKKLTKILWIVGVAFLLSSFSSVGPAPKTDDGNMISAADDKPVMLLAAKKGRKGKPRR